MATGSADAATVFLSRTPRSRFLWVTQRAAEPVPVGGEVLRVTTLSNGGRTLDPKRLGDLRDAVAGFLHDEGGLLVLDCLEYLVLHNGPERVARALADVHDEVTMHGGTLVVFVDATTANPRLVAWLAREFDPLPTTTAEAFQASDGLPA